MVLVLIVKKLIYFKQKLKKTIKRENTFFMSFWKNFFIDLTFIVLYYVMYKLFGFEITVVIALGQIMGAILQREKKI